MEIAKLDVKEESQIVVLPEAYQFEGTEVFIKRVGNAVVLIPRNAPWNSLFESLDMFSDDFMDFRNEPEIQERTGFLEDE